MMANFAKVTNNQVDAVIVVSNESCNDLPFPESEPVGQEFIASLGLDGEWMQTSYNANFRGKYAGSGDTYDAELDEFVAPPVPEIVEPVPPVN